MGEADPLSLLIERAIAVVLEERPPDWDLRLERLDATIRTLSEQYQQENQHPVERMPDEQRSPEPARTSLESMLSSATAKLVRAQMEYVKERQKEKVRGATPPPKTGTRAPLGRMNKP
jgi:hypothetical protein